MTEGDLDFQKKILESVLVASILNDSQIRFPKRKELILNELIKGTINYIGGEIPKVSNLDLSEETNYNSRRICRCFETEMESPDAKILLSRNFRNAIGALCYGRWHRTGKQPDYDIHFDVGFYPLLEKILLEDVNSLGYNPKTFSLPLDFISKVKKQDYPNFSPDVLEDVLGVGKSMRKYIEQDLDFIGR